MGQKASSSQQPASGSRENLVLPTDDEDDPPIGDEGVVGTLGLTVDARMCTRSKPESVVHPQQLEEPTPERRRTADDLISQWRELQEKLGKQSSLEIPMCDDALCAQKQPCGEASISADARKAEIARGLQAIADECITAPSGSADAARQARIQASLTEASVRLAAQVDVGRTDQVEHLAAKLLEAMERMASNMSSFADAQAPTPPPLLSAQPFAIGELVERRDAGDVRWGRGYITSINPLKVSVTDTDTGCPWDEVRRLHEEVQPTQAPSPLPQLPDHNSVRDGAKGMAAQMSKLQELLAQKEADAIEAAGTCCELEAKVSELHVKVKALEAKLAEQIKENNEAQQGGTARQGPEGMQTLQPPMATSTAKKGAAALLKGLRTGEVSNIVDTMEETTTQNRGLVGDAYDRSAMRLRGQERVSPSVSPSKGKAEAEDQDLQEIRLKLMHTEKALEEEGRKKQEIDALGKDIQMRLHIAEEQCVRYDELVQNLSARLEWLEEQVKDHDSTKTELAIAREELEAERQKNHPVAVDARESGQLGGSLMEAVDEAEDAAAPPDMVSAQIAQLQEEAETNSAKLQTAQADVYAANKELREKQQQMEQMAEELRQSQTQAIDFERAALELQEALATSMRKEQEHNDVLVQAQADVQEAQAQAQMHAELNEQLQAQISTQKADLSQMQPAELQPVVADPQEQEQSVDSQAVQQLQDLCVDPQEPEKGVDSQTVQQLQDLKSRLMYADEDLEAERRKSQDLEVFAQVAQSRLTAAEEQCAQYGATVNELSESLALFETQVRNHEDTKAELAIARKELETERQENSDAGREKIQKLEALGQEAQMRLNVAEEQCAQYDAKEKELLERLALLEAQENSDAGREKIQKLEALGQEAQMRLNVAEEQCARHKANEKELLERLTLLEAQENSDAGREKIQKLEALGQEAQMRLNVAEEQCARHEANEKDVLERVASLQTQVKNYEGMEAELTTARERLVAAEELPERLRLLEGQIQEGKDAKAYMLVAGKELEAERQKNTILAADKEEAEKNCRKKVFECDQLRNASRNLESTLEAREYEKLACQTELQEASRSQKALEDQHTQIGQRVRELDKVVQGLEEEKAAKADECRNYMQQIQALTDGWTMEAQRHRDLEAVSEQQLANLSAERRKNQELDAIINYTKTESARAPANEALTAELKASKQAINELKVQLEDQRAQRHPMSATQDRASDQTLSSVDQRTLIESMSMMSGQIINFDFATASREELLQLQQEKEILQRQLNEVQDYAVADRKYWKSECTSLQSECFSLKEQLDQVLKGPMFTERLSRIGQQLPQYRGKEISRSTFPLANSARLPGTSTPVAMAPARTLTPVKCRPATQVYDSATLAKPVVPHNVVPPSSTMSTYGTATPFACSLWQSVGQRSSPSLAASLQSPPPVVSPRGSLVTAMQPSSITSPPRCITSLPISRSSFGTTKDRQGARSNPTPARMLSVPLNGVAVNAPPPMYTASRTTLASGMSSARSTSVDQSVGCGTLTPASYRSPGELTPKYPRPNELIASRPTELIAARPIELMTLPPEQSLSASARQHKKVYSR